MRAISETPLVNFSPYCVSSDPGVVAALAVAAENFGYDYRKGITSTAPGFYAPQGRVFGNISSYAGNMVEYLAAFSVGLEGRDRRVINKEMESSAVNLLSRMFGFRSAAVCAVLASRKKGAFATPEEREKAIERAFG